MIFVNSCNVFVLHKIFFSNKLDLFQTTCFFYLNKTTYLNDEVKAYNHSVILYQMQDDIIVIDANPFLARSGLYY